MFEFMKAGYALKGMDRVVRPFSVRSERASAQLLTHFRFYLVGLVEGHTKSDFESWNFEWSALSARKCDRTKVKSSNLWCTKVLQGSGSKSELQTPTGSMLSMRTGRPQSLTMFPSTEMGEGGCARSVWGNSQDRTDSYVSHVKLVWAILEGKLVQNTRNTSSVVVQSRVVRKRVICCGRPVAGVIYTASSVTVESPAYEYGRDQTDENPYGHLGPTEHKERTTLVASKITSIPLCSWRNMIIRFGFVPHLVSQFLLSFFVHH